jgi:hypothetical protein
VTGEYDWLWWIVAIVLVIGVIAVWWVLRRGRPFAPGDVFRASRLSRGNHFFPAQVAINPTSVVQYTPRWFGKEELTIHMAHVASVNIKTGLLLSDVFIETSGGSDPIACHGHRKKDAVRIKELIEGYQTAYYKNESGQRAVSKGEEGKGQR